MPRELTPEKLRETANYSINWCDNGDVTAAVAVMRIALRMAADALEEIGAEIAAERNARIEHPLHRRMREATTAYQRNGGIALAGEADRAVEVWREAGCPEEDREAEDQALRVQLAAKVAQHDAVIGRLADARAALQEIDDWLDEDLTDDSEVIAEIADLRSRIAPHLGQACRVCGCTELDPCDPPCWWVEEDLCSECSEDEEE